MDPDTVFMLIPYVDVLVAVVATYVGQRCTGTLSFSITVATAVAIVFSPGLLVGHGVQPFLAVPAIFIQSESARLNAIPILVVFAISFAITYWLRRRAVRDKQAHG